jgi:hypothetical protein
MNYRDRQILHGKETRSALRKKVLKAGSGDPQVVEEA